MNSGFLNDINLNVKEFVTGYSSEQHLQFQENDEVEYMARPSTDDSLSSESYEGTSTTC